MSYTDPYLLSKSALLLHYCHATSTQLCSADLPWNPHRLRTENLLCIYMPCLLACVASWKGLKQGPFLGLHCPWQWQDLLAGYAQHQDLEAAERLLCCAGDRTWKGLPRRYLPITTMGHFLPTVSLNTLLPASVLWLCLLLVLDKMREGTKVQRSLNVIQGARKSPIVQTAVWTPIHPENYFLFRNLHKSRDTYNSTKKKKKSWPYYY